MSQVNELLFHVFVIITTVTSFEIQHVDNSTSGYVRDKQSFSDRSNHMTSSRQEDSYSTSGYQGDQNLCPSKTSCTVLSDCRLLLDLMDRTCLQPNKLKELTCGYKHSEVMVCCPAGGNNSPYRPGGGDRDHGGSDDHEDHDHDSGSGNKVNRQRLNQDCGKPQLNGWKNWYTGLGSQPWVARIGFRNVDTGKTEFPCCGSIITSKVVLTAAHCALAKSDLHKLHSVRIGEFDTESDPDCTATFCGHPVQDIDVSHVVVHPGFEKSIFRHDVALLVLKYEMNYSLSAQPICLLQNPNIQLVGRKARLAGWGKLPTQEIVPSKQQQLDLPVTQLEQCSRIYGRVIPVTTNQLCVGGEAKKDACSGFGGAPLVVLDHIKEDRFYQVGLVSFGSDKCGAAGVPSVYTNIQHYYDWIKSNIPQ